MASGRIGLRVNHGRAEFVREKGSLVQEENACLRRCHHTNFVCDRQPIHTPKIDAIQKHERELLKLVPQIIRQLVVQRPTGLQNFPPLLGKGLV